MPKTNFEFIAGQNSFPGESCPYRDERQALSWHLGRNTPKKARPGPDQALLMIAAQGWKGHNAAELIRSSRLEEL